MKTALVLACDENYLAYACIVARRAASLSTSDFPIIIVTDDVSVENRRLAQEFCPRIGFIEGSQVLAGNDLDTHNLTRAAFLRLFLDEILPDHHRIVYLDCDTTPLVDLAGLLDIAPKASPVAACYNLMDVPSEAVYRRLPISPTSGSFNSGVMVIDLEAVRTEGLFKTAVKLASRHGKAFITLDQDALCAALDGRWQVLDWRWNVCDHEASFLPRPHFLRHHGGGDKPWVAGTRYIEPFIADAWREALSESPWPHRYRDDPTLLRRAHTPSARKRLKNWTLTKLGLRTDRREQRYKRITIEASRQLDAMVGALGHRIVI